MKGSRTGYGRSDKEGWSSLIGLAGRLWGRNLGLSHVSPRTPDRVVGPESGGAAGRGARDVRLA